MKMLTRAAAVLLALVACATPALAQHATFSYAPAGPAPEVAPIVVAATSTPLTATPAAGTTVSGPFTPQLGRDLRIIIKGTWAGTISVGTSVDNCATVNPLTAGGATWGSFTANANEVVDTPTLAGVGYCVTSVITSGTPTIGLRQ
ncbi:MAG TPA: hypothetical protein VKQ27_17790 [Acetobacteraceae bacterium]|nr:hypothetical protein [Acetobacteraceae bacterium]